VRRHELDRSRLNDAEIRSIIERVKGRVAAAEFASRAGPTMRATDELVPQALSGYRPTAEA
jgi:hypothetical protein